MTTPRATAPRPAVFLDRDGTINIDTHYLRRPEDVQLILGAPEAIARLNAAGIPVIVVSNQSGIGRGLLTRAEYEAVRARIDDRLAHAGARIDATYICPHAPSPESGAALCECRKPGTLLFRTAAAEHVLDLPRSTFIGDRWRDVSPALQFGARGILVPSPDTPPADLARARAELQMADSLGAAVDLVLLGE
ncbi:MAG TPA: HAD family hydrolase [Gemmatimonadaceae bacterium]|nr:HAD family hydrolase [Gemmatimonadaceae bacterium]